MSKALIVQHQPGVGASAYVWVQVSVSWSHCMTLWPDLCQPVLMLLLLPSATAATVCLLAGLTGRLAHTVVMRRRLLQRHSGSTSSPLTSCRQSDGYHADSMSDAAAESRNALEGLCKSWWASCSQQDGCISRDRLQWRPSSACV